MCAEATGHICSKHRSPGVYSGPAFAEVMDVLVRAYVLGREWLWDPRQGFMQLGLR